MISRFLDSFRRFIIWLTAKPSRQIQIGDAPDGSIVIGKFAGTVEGKNNIIITDVSLLGTEGAAIGTGAESIHGHIAIGHGAKVIGFKAPTPDA